MAKDNDQQPAAPFYRRVSDIIRDPSEWADIDQVDIDLLDGAEIVVHDAMFLPGEFGKDYAIILFAGPTDGIAEGSPNGRPIPVNARTLACGGVVFVRKMKLLAGRKDGEGEDTPSQFPILGRVMKRQSKSPGRPEPYYDFA